ncbi:MAG: hypothetical protein ACR2KT_18690 [Methylocella sp.]
MLLVQVPPALTCKSCVTHLVVAAFAALVLVHRLGVFAGLAKEPPQPRLAAREQRA